MHFHGLNHLYQASLLTTEKEPPSSTSYYWTPDEKLRIKHAIDILHERGNTNWKVFQVASKISENGWIPGRSENAIRMILYKEFKTSLAERKKAASRNRSLPRSLCKILPSQLERGGSLRNVNPSSINEIYLGIIEIKKKYDFPSSIEELFEHVSSNCKRCRVAWENFVNRPSPELKRVRERNASLKKQLDDWLEQYNKGLQEIQNGERTERIYSSKRKRRRR